MTKATEQKTLMEVAQSVSKKRTQKRIEDLGTGFDNRVAFEALSAPGNTSIQGKLEGYRKKFILPGIAALTLATQLDANFMNTAGNNPSKRFNVYAIDKIADLLQGMNSGHLKNAVNRTIVQSLFKFRDAGAQFTALAAQGAVSANLEVPNDMKALLVRHTASPGTAPTQSSSTMNALMALNAVKNIGTHRHPVYELTTAPVVDRLEEIAA